MPNPEHAWKSLDDVCHGTHESPDIVPEAATCAREETDAVLDAVFSALADWGADKSALGNLDEQHNHLTGYGDACNFLGEAGDWDGVDRRWDNTIVRPYMRKELVSAITSDNAQHGWVCDSAPDGLLIGYDPDVDTSGGANKCPGISVLCLGKADEIALAPTSKSAAGGCDVSASRSSGFPGVLLMLGLLAIVSRRSLRKP
jgi:MYXO-CTERM domain-containing protein